MTTHPSATIGPRKPGAIQALPKHLCEEPADLIYRIAALTATLFVVATMF